MDIFSLLGGLLTQQSSKPTSATQRLKSGREVTLPARAMIADGQPGGYELSQSRYQQMPYAQQKRLYDQSIDGGNLRRPFAQIDPAIFGYNDTDQFRRGVPNRTPFRTNSQNQLRGLEHSTIFNRF